MLISVFGAFFSRVSLRIIVHAKNFEGELASYSTGAKSRGINEGRADRHRHADGRAMFGFKTSPSSLSLSHSLSLSLSLLPSYAHIHASLSPDRGRKSKLLIFSPGALAIMTKETLMNFSRQRWDLRA